jgi:FkbM family methyltransferase
MLSKVKRLLAGLAGFPLDEMALVYSLVRTDGPSTMVDVGAHHGQSLWRFAAHRWQVHAFEPDPANRSVLEKRVRGIPTVKVDRRAVAPSDGQSATLFTSPVSSGISTLSPFHRSHVPTATVETIRLDTYLTDVDAVAVLKTDAEGYDLAVLGTFPWDRMAPRVVVCEFEDSKATGGTFHEMAEFLVARGYVVFVSEWYPVLEYGRQHRWRSMKEFPTPLLDSSGWGNLIAVMPGDADRFRRVIGRETKWLWRVLRSFRPSTIPLS